MVYKLVSILDKHRISRLRDRWSKLSTVLWFNKHPQHCCRNACHYDDVTMTTMASQITSLTVVYSIVYSDANQRKHQSSASLAFVWGIHRWIPRTNGQLRGKCFHWMTSSCEIRPRIEMSHHKSCNFDTLRDFAIRRFWVKWVGFQETKH